MAQFVPFDNKVEVIGQAVLSVVAGMGSMKALALRILEENGIKDPQPEHWYMQKDWLNAFKNISDKIGPVTLKVIGKAIITNAKFPPEINTLEDALSLLDKAYHLNHRGGEIGYYKYTKIDDCKASMECNNPYPTAFDHGLIESMVQRYKPADSIRGKVSLDESKSNRSSGGDSDTFIIEW